MRCRQLPENKTCADCLGAYPRWASTNLGIFVCMTCSGIHRKLGTHLSQVRSVTLDTWTPSQIAHFQKLGNAKAAKYFEACLPQDFTRPHSSDSMRMEAFIRDKYENKRFITVENGGLGGAPSGRANISPALTSFPTLGSRPVQYRNKPLPYDEVGRSSSSSYSARFAGNVAPPHPPSYPPKAPKTHIDAVASATTLRELVNMGFATQLALRAVEATSGDLQRAVDWLLQHDSNNSASKSAPALTSSRPSAIPAKPVAADLLDFTDDSGPKSSDLKKPSASKSTDVPNFADFSDFETALPSTSSSVGAMPSTQGSNSLSRALADLYKQSRPAPPPPPPASESPEVQAMSLSPVPKNAVDNLFVGNDSDGHQSIMTGLKTGVSGINKQASLLSPPPPPPLQESAFPATEGGPPPPSPSSESTLLSQPVGPDVSGAPRNATEFRGNQPLNMTHKNENDKDPFAALSVMALSSVATSKKALPKTKTVNNVETSGASSKSKTAASANLSFEEFFG